MYSNARVPYPAGHPRVLDDDSAFPLGTIVTQSHNQELEYTYVKEHDRLYAVRGTTTNSPRPERSRVAGRDLPPGVVATFIDTRGRRVQFMKGPTEIQGQWVLLPESTVSRSRSPATGTNAVRQTVEVLQQAKYTGTRPPGVPPIEYHCTRMSDILIDTTVVRDSEAPAYDGKKVTNQKLSLRILFPGPGMVFNRPQFNVRFGGRGDRIITRGDLAFHIARELRTLMEDAERRGTFLHRTDRSRVQFEHLVLISVAFPSKGSIQPTIGLMRG